MHISFRLGNNLHHIHHQSLLTPGLEQFFQHVFEVGTRARKHICQDGISQVNGSLRVIYPGTDDSGNINSESQYPAVLSTTYISQPGIFGVFVDEPGIQQETVVVFKCCEYTYGQTSSDDQYH